ncbi:MAG: c-type cytochrome [Mariprofundaceae bacterium]|nr:c-type cytochrome [Mariprofundaceae bacterium]
MRTGVGLMLAATFSLPLTAEEFMPDAAQGGKAFKAICIHCHTITYDESRVGAPGLKGVLERHDEEWLDKWLKSPEAFAKVDEKAATILDTNKYGLKMPTLPEMQDARNRADMIAYLKTLKGD